MFHFFEAITNTKGDALIGYYVSAVDTSTGSVVNIYADQSSTPIVSVSGVANAAKVDSDGNASFYIAGGTYHLDIYATDATTFVKRIQYLPMVDATIAAGNVSSRANLQAVIATNGEARTLVESGREGTFVFSTANLSTQVAADTQQGIYIPPASDTTGASGAWVRKFSGAVDVKWFGAVADGATDDSAKFTAAIAYLYAASFNDNTLNKGSTRLRIPAGDYYLGTTTLDIHHGLIIEGEATGGGGLATRLRWADGATGIRVQRYNTTGGTATLSPTTRGGDGTIIRNLYLRGGYSSTEGEYHGVHLRARACIEDCLIYNFPGDGINISATAGGSPEGNANCSFVERVVCALNRNGIFIDGSDANACQVSNADCNTNRKWGIWDSSFLGNTFTSCHTSANGWDGAASSTPTACTYSGNRYAVIPGQETWCSTNAPSGTSASNQGWLYLGAGGTYNGIVAWVSSTTFRAGGSYYLDGGGGNQQNTMINCYAESDQNPTQVAGGTLVLAGTQPRAVWSGSTPWPGYLTGGGLGLTVNGPLQIGGANGSYDNLSSLQFTNSYGTLDFNYYTGSTTTVGYLRGFSSGSMVANTNVSWLQKINGTLTHTADSTGFVVNAGSLGYGAGAGGTVTQATSRTTGVTLNTACGAITLVSAAGSTSWQTFTVTNSKVAATDVIRVVQKSGTDLYMIHVTNVAAGSFKISFATTGGTTTEQPVFNFAVIKAVTA